MKSSSQFRRDAEKQKDKELAIIRDRKAISLHFPCSLIGNEHQIVKHMKAVKKLKKGLSGHVFSRKKKTSSNLVMFRVLIKGDKNAMKNLTNPALKAEIQEVIICEYKEKKVKQTRKRDGHFLNMKFIMNCALSERSTEVTTETSNLVGGKTFQIIFLEKSSPRDSQNSSQQSTITYLENNNLPRKKTKLRLALETENVLREIPGSKYLYSKLSSKSKDSIKGMKTQFPRLSRIQNLFRVEYGKNVETCREVKTMKLKEFYDSVCQVRIIDTHIDTRGSGFLLFGNYVFTNAHVIKDFYNDISRQLNGRVTVNFSFYDLKQPEEESVEVEEVVVYEYNPGVPPFDYALLRLSANKNLPRPLASRFGFLPKSGEIYIIGHPDGGVKKIDSCLIVPTENRIQVVERHYIENYKNFLLEILDRTDTIPLSSLYHYIKYQLESFRNIAISVQQQNITYKSQFYHGSSGSPVFDKHCNVVAMHSGGYEYPSASGKQNVIECGYALSDIMEHMIIQMVERERFDVLKDFLTGDFARCEEILINVKKLVDSRNLTTFKNVINNSVNITDTTLKKFFEFFCHVEAPVPMEFN